MSGDWDEDLCKKALVLVEELCFNSPRGYSQSERCQEFSYLLRGSNRQLDAGNAASDFIFIFTMSTFAKTYKYNTNEGSFAPVCSRRIQQFISRLHHLVLSV